MKLIKTKICLAVSAVLFSLPSLTLHAQETPDADTDDGDALEVIEVTSRKRAEPLNKIPVTVSAFTDEMIEQQGFTSVDDIARFSPGLSFSKAFGRSTERPVIRGMSNVLAGVQFGVESGAAYFVDGAYYSGDILSLDLNDLERVEVVKGPQSALYGRNSYSGAINFITKGPNHDELEGYAKGSFGSDGERTLNFSVNGPLTESIAGSLMARSYNYDGEWVNTVTNDEIGQEKTNSLSLVLDGEHGDSFHWRWRSSVQEDDDGTRPFFLQSAEQNNCQPGFRSLAFWPASFSQNTNQYYCGPIQPGTIALNDQADADGVPNGVPGVPTASFLPAGVTFFGNPYDVADGTAFDGVERDLKTTTFAADFETDAGYLVDGAFSFRSEDTKTGSDSDHSSVNFTFFPGSEGFFALSSRNHRTDKSLEVKVRSPESDVQWMIGGFVYEQKNDGYDLTFASPEEGDKDSFSSVKNRALFASIDVKYTDKLDATFEARYAEEEKIVTEFAGDGSVDFDNKGTWTNFTPRVTLNYQWNDETIVYGVLAKGVKPGGFNGSSGASVGRDTYEQEETKALEIGLKTRAIENIDATVSWYFNDVSDLQLTTPIASPDGALNSIATNQGEGEVMGLEIDITAQLTENLFGRFTYALADSEFTAGCDDFQWSLTSGGGLIDPTVNNGNGGSDFTQIFGGTGGDCSIKGNQFPLSSKNQASLFLEYSRELSGEMQGFLNMDVSYEGKKFVQVHNLAYVPEATVVGARAGIRAENWTLTVFARNLTDEDAPVMATRWLAIPYFTFSSLNVAPANADRSSPRAFFGNPRRGKQFGAEFSYRF